jgi:hypothetical protein
VITASAGKIKGEKMKKEIVAIQASLERKLYNGQELDGQSIYPEFNKQEIEERCKYE